MWREYLGFVATAIAVINGLLAITIAMLPVRRSVARLRLGVVALVLGGAAAGTTFYLKHYTRVHEERLQADRREVRERLETFTLEGRTLLGQIKDTKRELPTRPADEWAQRAEVYLRDRLGERYVARFRRDVNDMYGDATLPAARLGYWRAVRNRVVNLEMISAELPEQPPSPLAPSPPAPTANQ
jgi:hypothetical protein